MSLHPLAADSVLQITSGRDQIRSTVESSRAQLFSDLAAWFIFHESRSKLHRADRANRKSEAQERIQASGQFST